MEGFDEYDDEIDRSAGLGGDCRANGDDAIFAERRAERASANDPNLHPCASLSPVGAGQREDTRNVGIVDAMQ